MNREDNYWIRRSARPITRRRWLGGALATGAGLAAAAAAGCGDDDNNKDSSNGTPTSTQGAGNPSPTAITEQPKRGGVWRAVMPGDPTNLDPYAGTSFTTTQIGAFVYSRLLKFKSGPGIDPALYQTEMDLAESVKSSEDGLTYTVTLKKSAKWHPPVSRLVDADDVVFSWKRYTGQITGTPANASATALNDYLASVEKIDASTVTFKLKKTRGEFLTAESSGKFLFIMPKETGTVFDPAQQMVGTGPWIFESYTPGSVIKFKRNPEWHLGPERPYFDSVEMNFIPEYATRLNQFLAGNLDEVDINGNDLERAQSTVKGMQLQVGESILPASYITFEGGPSAASSPWRDARVRKAVSMALNRDDMLDSAYNLKDVEKLNIGAKRRWNNDLPSFEGAYWLDPTGKFQVKPSDPKMTAENQKAFAYNPADAKKLLELAGFKDGFKTKLHTTSARYGQAFNTLTELVQLYCSQIGITLELVDEDYSSVYVTKTARGEFDGLAHIPRGAGARSQSEIYYLPGGIRNNAKVEDKTLEDNVRKMLAERDAEKARLQILDLQNYTNDKMYLVPMQLGASGVYIGYASSVKNALQYQVNVYDQGNETIPWYWRA